MANGTQQTTSSATGFVQTPINTTSGFVQAPQAPQAPQASPTSTQQARTFQQRTVPTTNIPVTDSTISPLVPTTGGRLATKTFPSPPPINIGGSGGSTAGAIGLGALALLATKEGESGSLAGFAGKVVPKLIGDKITETGSGISPFLRNLFSPIKNLLSPASSSLTAGSTAVTGSAAATGWGSGVGYVGAGQPTAYVSASSLTAGSGAAGSVTLASAAVPLAIGAAFMALAPHLTRMIRGPDSVGPNMNSAFLVNSEGRIEPRDYGQSKLGQNIASDMNTYFMDLINSATDAGGLQFDPSKGRNIPQIGFFPTRSDTTQGHIEGAQKGAWWAGGHDKGVYSKSPEEAVKNWLALGIKEGYLIGGDFEKAASSLDGKENDFADYMYNKGYMKHESNISYGEVHDGQEPRLAHIDPDEASTIYKRMFDFRRYNHEQVLEDSRQRYDEEQKERGSIKQAPLPTTLRPDETHEDRAEAIAKRSAELQRHYWSQGM